MMLSSDWGVILKAGPAMTTAATGVPSLKGVPVLGIPACGLFAQAAVFDLVYPRILGGERMTRKNIAKLGHGGLCLQCKPCRYPDCSFVKSF